MFQLNESQFVDKFLYFKYTWIIFWIPKCLFRCPLSEFCTLSWASGQTDEKVRLRLLRNGKLGWLESLLYFNPFCVSNHGHFNAIVKKKSSHCSPFDYINTVCVSTTVGCSTYLARILNLTRRCLFVACLCHFFIVKNYEWYLLCLKSDIIPPPPSSSFADTFPVQPLPSINLPKNLMASAPCLPFFSST